ncbi:hypothetical protein K491DRAFT_699046 [Lophiostoma macrostomum CBS 122681]|uniref:Uncharacterized protein n=1 Tax=Lophiostoma macrostomum CBS 122681 TaxID=1314788 RepID=A0A6A6SK86_9PLEO|nr:hypothetical protein K491DRAFT_699046 [Lophiostoma macrostomum CBS 122681]
MVSTHSKTAQTHLEDFTTPASKLKSKPQANIKKKAAAKPSTSKSSSTSKPAEEKPAKSTSSKKHKSADTSDVHESPQPKRAKKASTSTNKNLNTSDDDAKIIINRAPVLHLWSACLTQFLYPQLPWSTCVSAGSAVSTICAVAKGRSIGTVPEKDVSTNEKKKKAKAKKDAEDLDEVKVMQFKLKLKDGLALVGSGDKKGKPGDELTLKNKFGEGGFEKVKGVFDEALASWKGQEEELNGKGFGFYEAFRPDVSKGQKGWGRKGELDMGKIREVVGR